MSLSGTVACTPKATVAGGSVDRFQLFVDGVRTSSCTAGSQLTLDTTTLANGYHELRVVAITADAVETQGRLVVPVFFRNHGRQLTMTATPQEVPLNGQVRIQVDGSGIDGVLVFGMGRILGRVEGTSGSIDVPAVMLGRGRVMVYAAGRGGRSPAEAVNAAPVPILVGE